MSTAPRPSFPAPLLGWTVGATFFLYAWILRVSPSVMVEELMRDFALGGAILGHLSALYFYGYAGMQIPVGLLLDRFGPRRLLTGAATVCALGCVLFATGGLAVASTGRFLVGVGCAFSLVGAMAVAGQWFPARRFALLAGLAMMAGMLGGVLGQAPLRLAVETFDWRTTIVLAAAVGIAIAIAAWLLVRDRERGTGGVPEMLAGLRAVAARRQLWLNAAAGLGATGPLLGFGALWGVPYVEALHGVPRSEAGAVTSLMFLGWGAGAPFFGWLSDRIGRRRPPLLVGMVVSIAATSAVVWWPATALVGTAMLCFAIGFGGSAQIVGFAIARETTPIRRSATAIGILNAAVTGAGALFQPLIGWLLDLSWNGVEIDGARFYAIADYRVALGVLVVAGAIGFGCALRLEETFCETRA